MIPWAKMASDLDSNPKIARAGFLGTAVYLFLLRRNALMGADGTLSAEIIDPEYLAEQLRCTVEQAATGCNACNVAGLIFVADRCVVISGWEEWSPAGGKKALSSTERSRKRRENIKHATMQRDATLHATANATATTEKSREEEKREISDLCVAPRAHDPTVPAPVPVHVPAPKTGVPGQLGQLLEHAIRRLDAARAELDPEALLTGSALTLPAVQRDQLLGKLRATDERDRAATLDHCLDVLIAAAKAKQDVGMMRIGMLAGDSSWDQWRTATVASVSGPRAPPAQARPAQPLRGAAAARAETARLEALDALDAQETR